DFRRQFAGSDRELRAAAATMGMFGVQYAEGKADFSDAERAHYGQLEAAMAQGAAGAPLADRALARAAIPRLVAAARAAGPTTAEGIAAAGMDASLERLGAFANEAKRIFAGHGLDLDASFDSVQASLQVQQGDQATVRLRYTLAGHPIDTLVPVERIDGRWYLSDYLRHAREAVRSADPPAGPQPALGHNVDAAKPAFPVRARPGACRPGARGPPSTTVVGAPARAPAGTLDRAEHRAAGPGRQPRWPPGLLCARGLRHVQRPDPRPRLPRGRAGIAAGAAARRPAGPPARPRRPAAAQRRQRPGPAHPDRHPAQAPEEEKPLRLAGAPARGPPRRSGAGRAAGAGVDLRRPRAGQEQRLVFGAVFGELGDR